METTKEPQRSNEAPLAGLHLVMLTNWLWASSEAPGG
jgi:hypothetical protein